MLCSLRRIDMESKELESPEDFCYWLKPPNNPKAWKLYLICCEYHLIITLVEFQNQTHDAKEVTATLLYRLRKCQLNKGSILKNFVHGKGVIFLRCGFFLLFLIFFLPNSSFIIHHPQLLSLFYAKLRFTKAFSQSFYFLKIFPWCLQPGWLKVRTNMIAGCPSTCPGSSSVLP